MIDYESALVAIEKAIFSPATVTVAMGELVDHCASQMPGDHWKAIKDLPWEKSIDELQGWVEKILQTEPPDDDVDALYFGVYYPETDDGSPRIPVLYFAGTDSFDGDEWTVTPAYAPEGMDHDSPLLVDLHTRLGAVSEAVQLLGNYVLSFGYICLVGRELARRVDRALLVGGRKLRHLACGFEGAEYFNLGRLKPDSTELE